MCLCRLDFGLGFTGCLLNGSSSSGWFCGVGLVDCGFAGFRCFWFLIHSSLGLLVLGGFGALLGGVVVGGVGGCGFGGEFV